MAVFRPLLYPILYFVYRAGFIYRELLILSYESLFSLTILTLNLILTMLFYLGIVFVLVGIVMLVKFIMNSRRPKVDALVLSLMKETPQGQFVDVPHALVEYFYNSTKYNAKVVLASKPKVGDSITLAVTPSQPTKIAEYYPKKEVLVLAIAIGVGVALMLGTLMLSDII